MRLSSPRSSRCSRGPPARAGPRFGSPPSDGGHPGRGLNCSGSKPGIFYTDACEYMYIPVNTPMYIHSYMYTYRYICIAYGHIHIYAYCCKCVKGCKTHVTHCIVHSTYHILHGTYCMLQIACYIANYMQYVTYCYVLRVKIHTHVRMCT